MSFKKNGSDPGFDRPAAPLPGLGGSAWSAFTERAAAVAQEFVNAALGMTRAPAQPEEHLRYRRSRRPQQKRKRRSNRLIISKRVRRKHRRARA